MSLRAVPLLATFMFVMLSSAALAQISVGPTVFLSLPEDDFADVAKTGAGFGIVFLFSRPSIPALAMRADLAAAFYGSKEDIPLTEEFGPEIIAHLKIRRQGYRLTIGPQFQTTTSPVRFYAAPLVGLYHYRAVEKIEGDFPWENQTVTSTKFGYALSAGFLVDVSHCPPKRFNLALDLGAKYHAVKDILGPWPFLDAESTDVNEVVLHAGVLFLF
jgi:hypothetical protein